MSSVHASTSSAPISDLGRSVIDGICNAGNLTLFGLRTLSGMWSAARHPRQVLVHSFVVGVQSRNVVMMTGAFIGMVTAVQTYDQLRLMGLESNLGTIINMAVLKELGPVLAATMLAGRIGCSMAAELGTMKVTEQLDALRALGANPIHHLVVPRFLACVLMTPLLTLLADAAGVLSGWFVSTVLLGINNSHYWNHTELMVKGRDVLFGAGKGVFFGAAIALVSCHRGFHAEGGAEGVGKAATAAFVNSFLAILILDFLLAIVINLLQRFM
jgi:phospholipid/cholesterol/gamma-HCH transport system permease protein